LRLPFRCRVNKLMIGAPKRKAGRLHGDLCSRRILIVAERRLYLTVCRRIAGTGCIYRRTIRDGIAGKRGRANQRATSRPYNEASKSPYRFTF
jgi:hypothetical protein